MVTTPIAAKTCTPETHNNLEGNLDLHQMSRGVAVKMGSMGNIRNNATAPIPAGNTATTSAAIASVHKGNNIRARADAAQLRTNGRKVYIAYLDLYHTCGLVTFALVRTKRYLEVTWLL